MKLVKPAARRFVDRVGTCANPASYVAKAWGCEQATHGSNVNGHVANTWRLPGWCHAKSERVTVTLTPHQLMRWSQRRKILRDCLDAANPVLPLIRETLRVTKCGPSFPEAEMRMTAKGECNAIARYRHNPTATNVTRDGDIQSNVSRLPEPLRIHLQIDGHPVSEFDVKSAHAVILAHFYATEIGPEWEAERIRFALEAEQGFPDLYGRIKEWKVGFLSALNQSPSVARHASPGYAEFARLFPLLENKVARLRRRNPKALGRILRSRLAEIMSDAVQQNHDAGIRCIPVVDSIVVEMKGDLREVHRAEFSTAGHLGVPLANLTGLSARIEGSNGDNFRFFV